MIGWLAPPAGVIAGVAAWRLGYAALQHRASRWFIGNGTAGIALTFDDGPDANTAGVLDDLSAAGVHATFFLLGERVSARPDVVRRLVSEGHEAEVHGWTHRNPARLSRATLAREIGDARKAVEDAAGVATTLYRPPYGVLTPAAASAARAMGLRPYLWTHWARDWKLRTPADIRADCVRALVPGAVILLHDGEGTGGEDHAVANMRAALTPFLRDAQAAGWRLGPLGALLRPVPPP